MATNPFKTKQFEALKKKWYKKLDNSGFEDVESDEYHLKQWDSYNFSNSGRSRYGVNAAQREEYFRLAGQFLHSHSFNTPKEKMIWELHSNGQKNREISRILQSRRYKHHSKDYVRRVVGDLAKEMLRQYARND